MEIDETIFGGITPDTVDSACEMLDGHMPACLLMSRHTALEFYKAYDQATPPFPPDNEPILDPWQKITVCIVNDHMIIPDDVIRVFTSKGEVKTFQFQ